MSDFEFITKDLSLVTDQMVSSDNHSEFLRKEPQVMIKNGITYHRYYISGPWYIHTDKATGETSKHGVAQNPGTCEETLEIENITKRFPNVVNDGINEMFPANGFFFVPVDEVDKVITTLKNYNYDIGF